MQERHADFVDKIFHSLLKEELRYSIKSLSHRQRRSFLLHAGWYDWRRMSEGQDQRVTPPLASWSSANPKRTLDKINWEAMRQCRLSEDVERSGCIRVHPGCRLISRMSVVDGSWSCSIRWIWQENDRSTQAPLFSFSPKRITSELPFALLPSHIWWWEWSRVPSVVCWRTRFPLDLGCILKVRWWSLTEQDGNRSQKGVNGPEGRWAQSYGYFGCGPGWSNWKKGPVSSISMFWCVWINEVASKRNSKEMRVQHEKRLKLSLFRLELSATRKARVKWRCPTRI